MAEDNKIGKTQLNPQRVDRFGWSPDDIKITAPTSKDTDEKEKPEPKK
jgi:hypothetical protein